MSIEYINIESAFNEEPPALDFVMPGVLRKSVGLLIGAGSIGKSMFMLQLSASIAGAGDLLGLGVSGSKKVVYLSLEDPSDVVINRYHALGKILDLNARKAVIDNLKVGSLYGRTLDMSQETGLELLNLQLPDQFDLLIIDTLSRSHSSEEKDNGEMSRLVSSFEALANAKNASIILVHHVAKANIADDSEASISHLARGAGALTDNARWVALLHKPTDKDGLNKESFVKFSIAKTNYMRPTEPKFFERRDFGLLFPCESSKTIQSSVKTSLQSAIDDTPQEHQKSASATVKAGHKADKTKQIKSKEDLESFIESGEWMKA